MRKGQNIYILQLVRLVGVRVELGLALSSRSEKMRLKSAFILAYDFHGAWLFFSSISLITRSCVQRAVALHLLAFFRSMSRYSSCTLHAHGECGWVT